MAGELLDKTVRDLIKILEELKEQRGGRNLSQNTEAVKDNTSSLEDVVKAIEQNATDLIRALATREKFEERLQDLRDRAEYNSLLRRKKMLEDEEKERKKQTNAIQDNRTHIQKFTDDFIQKHEYDLKHMKTQQDLFEFYRKIQQRYGAASNEEIDAIKRLIRWKHAEQRTSEQLNNHYTKILFGTDLRYATDNIKMWAYELAKNYNWIVLLGKGLKGLHEELLKSREVGLPAFSQGIIQVLRDSFNTGMSTTELLDFKKQFVMTGSAAADGLNGFVKQVSEGAFEAMDKGLVASQKEWTQLNASLFDAVIKTGVKYKDAAKPNGPVDRLKKSFENLHKSVAMTSTEFAEMTQAIANDTEHRKLMLRMSPKQREAYVADTVAIQEHLITQKKVSKEQAQAMTDFIKKIQGETFKDRMKRALKTRLAMGLMGVSGGADMQQLIMKPAGSLSKDEKIRMQGYQDQMSRAGEARRGMGGVNELFVDTLNDKTNGIIDESRVMNTTLEETKSINKDIKGNTEKMFNTLDSMYTFLATGIGATWRLGITGLLLSAVALLGSMTLLLKGALGRGLLGQGSSSGWFKDLFKKKQAEEAAVNTARTKEFGEMLKKAALSIKDMGKSVLGGMATMLISGGLRMIGFLMSPVGIAVVIGAVGAALAYLVYKSGAGSWIGKQLADVTGASDPESYKDHDKIASDERELAALRAQVLEKRKRETVPTDILTAQQQQREKDREDREKNEIKEKNSRIARQAQDGVTEQKIRDQQHKQAVELLTAIRDYSELIADSTKKTAKKLNENRS